MNGSGDSSSGVVIAIVLFVALFGGILLLRWLVGRGADAVVNNTINRRSVQAGAEMTSSDLLIHTAAAPQAAMAAVRQHVVADQAAPAVATALYLDGVGDQGLRYAYGNKLGTSFVAHVVITPAPAGPGSEVLVEVVNWTKSGATKAGATIQHGPRMQRLRDEVMAAIRSIDPAASAQIVARQPQ